MRVCVDRVRTLHIVAVLVNVLRTPLPRLISELRATRVYVYTVNMCSAVNDCHTDMLELDCQLTADGQVVVAHDDSLRRLCGVDTSIHSLTYKVSMHIRQLLSHVRFSVFHNCASRCRSILIAVSGRAHTQWPHMFNVDRHYTVAGPSDDRRIPLLTEVFDRYPNTVINVDVKSDDARLMEKVSRA
jgi:glycerophosphoryl diester phosphodiesterase